MTNKERGARWYAANREKTLAASKRWRDEHPEAAHVFYVRHKERIKAASRRYRERNREKILNKKFRMAPGEFEFLLASQGGVCAICAGIQVGKFSGRRLAVDHDHVTGKVRGLLCDRCNSAIGLLRDDGRLAAAAAAYLGIKA